MIDSVVHCKTKITPQFLHDCKEFNRHTESFFADKWSHKVCGFGIVGEIMEIEPG